MSRNNSGSIRGNRNSIILIVAAFILLIAILIVVLIIRGMGIAFPPTQIPGTTATLTPTSIDLTDEVWIRIQAQGEMIVGVAVDYPPFEFYDKDFQLDGLDIALIREIGQILDVKVEFRDIAFDGLRDALQIGQIDIAISAISVTPERQEVVDFSNVYFVSADAFLAVQNSTISIDKVNDLTSYRLGVQNRSVFQDWLQSELVSTNKMASGNLFIYREINKAVEDVSRGEIDLVVMDLPPARIVESSGFFKIVGQGLNQQRFAIAMPKGATRLQMELNNAIIQLQSSGRVNSLIMTYLGMVAEDISPYPTPSSGGSTTTPDSNACFDAMAFVKDLSNEDTDIMNPPVFQPGRSFSKGWRVRNIGTCTWDGTYGLVYAGGNDPAARMGGLPASVQGQVLPGNTYDFWVNLVAPIKPSTYQGFWTMHSGRSGGLFGSRLWIGIEVPTPPTATPKPTQTPSPDIRFSANPIQINEGDCSVISWEAEDNKEVFMYRQGEPWQENTVDLIGNREVCPATTTTFELRVVKLDNLVEVRQVSVFVIQNPIAPDIAHFTVEPNQILGGQCVQIQWGVEGDVNTVRLTRNNEILRDDAPLSGTREDCPPGTGEQVYGIETIGPGGTSRAQRFITVVEPTALPTATPTLATGTPSPVTPTNTPAPPAINAFAAVPNQILIGDCVQVSWDVGSGAELIQIIRNEAVILDNAPFSGSGQDCLDEPGVYVYRIEARNNGGVIDSREVIVNAYVAQPDNPLTGTSWSLVSYFDGAELVPIVIDVNITAVFTEQGEINGSAGCNIFSAMFSVGGDAILIDGLTTTQRTCAQPEGIMQLEAIYLSLLDIAQMFRINDLNDDELTINAVIEGEDKTIISYQREQ